MKSELKIKWLQYLKNRSDRKTNNIQFIVSIAAIVFGILITAIFSQLFAGATKTKQNEARSNIGAMGRAQQVFYLEYGHFSNDLEKLGIGIRSQTYHYKYEVLAAQVEKPTIINNLAIPIVDHFDRAYISIVSTTIIDGKTVSISTVCVSEKPTEKNPIWEGLPTKGTLEDVRCDCIRVGGQKMVNLSK